MKLPNFSDYIKDMKTATLAEVQRADDAYRRDIERWSQFERDTTPLERLRWMFIGFAAPQFITNFGTTYVFGPSGRPWVGQIFLLAACVALGFAAIGFRRVWTREAMYALDKLARG